MDELLSKSIRIAELILREQEGVLSQEERAELAKLIDADSRYKESYEQLKDKNSTNELVQSFNDASDENVVFDKIVGQLGITKNRQFPLGFSTIAASILIIACLSGLYYRGGFWRKKASGSASSNAKAADVAPAVHGASLRLADGSVIALDSSVLSVANQGASKVVIGQGGVLAYKPSEKSSPATLYNTLSTAKGQRFQLNLPDGSRVWLNAGSTVKYFVTLGTKETVREVDLEGEAYFEVAANKSLPFIVKANGTNVRVLGTSFDVMSYADEPTGQTTLLTGAVSISEGNESKVLHPGQQMMNSSDGDFHVRSVDTAQVVAWKNETFDFRKTTLPQIMRQLARWYDVEIVYEGDVSDDLFSAYLSSNLPISKILNLLSETREVQFTIEGKKIIVKQKN